jgi:hypothetical protein
MFSIILTYKKLQVEVFWVVIPCSVVVRYHHFRGLLPPFLHLEDGGSMDL